MNCKKCNSQMELKEVNTEVFRISIIEYKCTECSHITTVFLPKHIEE